MACFVVPVAEAIVTTAVAYALKTKEKKAEPDHAEIKGQQIVQKIPFSKKLNWLSRLLWGGSILLLFEHIWHGEVVPWFPFLTAAADPVETVTMLHEMATVGVSMSVFLTLVWVGMLLVANHIQNKAIKTQTIAE